MPRCTTKTPRAVTPARPRGDERGGLGGEGLVRLVVVGIEGAPAALEGGGHDRHRRVGEREEPSVLTGVAAGERAAAKHGEVVLLQRFEVALGDAGALRGGLEGQAHAGAGVAQIPPGRHQRAVPPRQARASSARGVPGAAINTSCSTERPSSVMPTCSWMQPVRRRAPSEAVGQVCSTWW